MRLDSRICDSDHNNKSLAGGPVKPQKKHGPWTTQHWTPCLHEEFHRHTGMSDWNLGPVLMRHSEASWFLSEDHTMYRWKWCFQYFPTKLTCVFCFVPFVIL